MKGHVDKILCPICKRIGAKSSHHVLPQRYFGNIGKTVLLCRACHNRLEEYIKQAEALPAERYIELFEEFVELNKKD